MSDTTTTIIMSSLMNQIHEISALKAELRRRTMIYQCDEKERAAKYFNRPLSTYYHFSYENWCKVRAIYHRKLEAKV